MVCEDPENDFRGSGIGRDELAWLYLLHSIEHREIIPLPSMECSETIIRMRLLL